MITHVANVDADRHPMSSAPSSRAETRRAAISPGLAAEPGATLISEAEALISRRQWRRCIKVLEAAKTVGSANPRLDELMAVAANHAGKRAQRAEALSRLRARDQHSLSSALALTRVALTNRQFDSADAMARQALAADSNSPHAWNMLAASYCAQGWFDEASTCLDAGADIEDPADRWYLGKAINFWAMSRTQTLLVTIIAVLLFGVVGLAVGIAVPMITRELRVANLPARFKELAGEQWKTEHRLRFLNGLAVLAVVIVALLIPPP